MNDSWIELDSLEGADRIRAADLGAAFVGAAEEQRRASRELAAASAKWGEAFKAERAAFVALEAVAAPITKAELVAWNARREEQSARARGDHKAAVGWALLADDAAAKAEELREGAAFVSPELRAIATDEKAW